MLQGKYTDVVTIEQRISTSNISTGFIERWESMGDFYAAVTEMVSSNSSLQQQVSSLSRYSVEIADCPQISYADSRFRYTDRFGNQKLLQPDRDPKYFNSQWHRYMTVECVNIENLITNEDVDTSLPSVWSPPSASDYAEQIFYGDGSTLSFYPPFTITPESSTVTVANSYQTLNIDYYEFSDHITLEFPPEDGVEIVLRARRT